MNAEQFRARYPNEGVWKNTTECTREATFDTIVIVHKDKKVVVGETYSMDMCHILTIRGKAFMPCVFHNKSIDLFDCRSNGRSVAGTDCKAYDAALAQGQEMMERYERELKEKTEQSIREYDEHIAKQGRVRADFHTTYPDAAGVWTLRVEVNLETKTVYYEGNDAYEPPSVYVDRRWLKLQDGTEIDELDDFKWEEFK